jgi:hypothetical protein
MTILKNHISPDTAYLVNDYPYGFRLRCQIRYWLEYHNKYGIRFAYQTSNPKKDNIWNKPKYSTYSLISGAMFLDDNNHVQFIGLTEYSDYKESLEFYNTYREGIPEKAIDKILLWLDTKKRYEEKISNGINYQSAGIEVIKENLLNGKRL